MPVGAIMGSIAGPLLGAVGSKLGGKKPTVTTGNVNMTESTTGSSTGSRKGATSGYSIASEDPMMTLFRQALVPLMAQQFNRAQGPLYGDAEKASLLQDIDTTYRGVTEQILNHLSSVGALNSGRAATTLENAGFAKAGDITKFLSQIPMLNRQYSEAQVGSMLNLMAGLTGRAPISTFTGGTASESSSQQFAQTNNRQGTQSATQQLASPGFLGSLFSLLGNQAFDKDSQLSNLINKIPVIKFGGGN